MIQVHQKFLLNDKGWNLIKIGDFKSLSNNIKKYLIDPKILKK